MPDRAGEPPDQPERTMTARDMSLFLKKATDEELREFFTELRSGRLRINGMMNSPKLLIGRRFRESLLARCRTSAERAKLLDFMTNATQREKTRFFMNLRANRVKVTDSPLHYRRRPPRYRWYRITSCFVWVNPATGDAAWPDDDWAYSVIDLQ